MKYCEKCKRYFRDFDDHDYHPYVGPIKIPKRHEYEYGKRWEWKPIGPFAVFIYAKLRNKDDMDIPSLRLEIYFLRRRIFMHKFIV